jgi:hypothetical protein
MSWFTRAQPKPDLTPRVEALERALKGLTLDWDETFERFQRLSARLAKRAADAERRDGDPGSGDLRAPGLPQDRRSGTERITNPLARRLLSGPFTGNEES